MMKRVFTAAFLLATLVGASACTESATIKKSANAEFMQVSSIHWDEVAAADNAARVTNNGLIMMR